MIVGSVGTAERRAKTFFLMSFEFVCLFVCLNEDDNDELQFYKGSLISLARAIKQLLLVLCIVLSDNYNNNLSPSLAKTGAFSGLFDSFTLLGGITSSC